MMILVKFSPKISDLDIKQEAIRLLERQDDSEAVNSNEFYSPQEAKDLVCTRTMLCFFLGEVEVLCIHGYDILFCSLLNIISNQCFEIFLQSSLLTHRLFGMKFKLIEAVLPSTLWLIV